MSQSNEAVPGLEEAYNTPLDQFDVGDPALHRDNKVWGYFERLRKEDPVHFCKGGVFGDYWSITKYDDIVFVDSNHELFSSENRPGGISIMDDNKAGGMPMFIALDPPKHTDRRSAVTPVVAPQNLKNLSSLIRERTQGVLDGLPLNEEFDWVEKVSVDLTTKMLATLFDVPWEDRSKLTYWSDIFTTVPGAGMIDSEEERMPIIQECADYMGKLWMERANSDEPRTDVLSMLSRSEKTKDMTPEEILGDSILLIIGGNDTTRNSMSGGVLALSQFPGEYEKLCSNPALIPSAASEIIRWQTPLAHMRRNATQDVEVGGKLIKKGDKVAMWYASGNRDDGVIERANEFIIDRKNVRRHLSFGFGVHRCLGNRLAEMQLMILWEEILKRWPKAGQLEVLGEPTLVMSSFVRGIDALPVRINA